MAQRILNKNLWDNSEWLLPHPCPPKSQSSVKWETYWLIFLLHRYMRKADRYSWHISTSLNMITVVKL